MGKILFRSFICETLLQKRRKIEGKKVPSRESAGVLKKKVFHFYFDKFEER